MPIPTYKCPACNSRLLIDALECSACGEDLRMVGVVLTWPYRLYEECQHCLVDGDIAGALLKACAALECATNDKALVGKLKDVIQDIGISVADPQGRLVIQQDNAR